MKQPPGGGGLGVWRLRGFLRVALRALVWDIVKVGRGWLGMHGHGCLDSGYRSLVGFGGRAS